VWYTRNKYKSQGDYNTGDFVLASDSNKEHPIIVRAGDYITISETDDNDTEVIIHSPN
jgi:hypothetical protein